MSKTKDLYLGCVNTPIYQTSTILFDDISELKGDGNKYGRAGTETNFALESEITKIENGYKSIVTSSGLGAITAAIFTFLSKGDHILLCDSVYGPTKILCDNHLKKFGVEASYYDSEIGVEIEKLIHPNTKVIFLESPSSLTYQIQEISEIVNVAKKHNINTIIDNTWGVGCLFKPLDHGIDVSVQSGSKYFAGHSDVLIGSITAKNKEIYDKIWAEYYQLGYHASPQDCYLAIRGIKTLKIRLEKHFQSALKIAEFLESRSEINEVLYPALPSFKQYGRFKKYFSGANGLISFSFKKGYNIEQIRDFVNNLEIFKIGYSWGGFESLVMLYENFPLVRIHVGIEDCDKLQSDLDNAFAKVKGS